MDKQGQDANIQSGLAPAGGLKNSLFYSDPDFRLEPPAILAELNLVPEELKVVLTRFVLPP